MYQLKTNNQLRHLRTRIISAIHATGGGHFGGCLSVVEILVAVFHQVLPSTDPRDRVILSKGHAAMTLYSIMSTAGMLEENLESYGTFDSKLEGHPDMLALPKIDFSTGSLGQGLSVGIGMALAISHTNAHTWVVLGDGECQEGQVWEAASLGGRYRNLRICALIDMNGSQEYGWLDRNNIPLPHAKEKWQSFGWNVIECSGNKLISVLAATNRAKELTGPTVILAHTRKGCGVPIFEKEPERYHCAVLTEEEFRIAIASLRES